MKDRYDILEQLGEGGAGAVFKAWDKRLQRYVAIKRLLPPEARESLDAGTDLAKEAAALSSLQHPNVISVYDLEQWDDEPCVVMEFLNGETLEETMRRGALTPTDFYTVARQCLEGLAAAHALKIQHRDIKPSNIMVNWLPNGDFLVKMLDFGLAEFTTRPHSQLTEDDRAFGSVYFMAPEQFNNRPVDARTDLYSLGCVLYYALTAKYPFTGRKMEDVIQGHLIHKLEPLHSQRNDLPKLTCDWVLWLMSRDPEMRPQSVEEALQAFKQIVTGELKVLPTKRGLKTQAVVAAPGATSPSGPTGVKSASVAAQPASLTSNNTRSIPKVEAKSKINQKTILWAGGATLAAIGLVFGIVKGTSGRSPTPPSEPQAPATAPQASSQNNASLVSPPKADLVLWTDGSSPIKTKKGTAPAKPGERIDLWEDRERNFGANHIHYIFSKTPPKQDKLPILAIVENQFGLKGNFPVVRFQGDQNLLLATDDAPATATDILANLKLFESERFGICIVFRTSSPEKGELISCNTSTTSNGKIWEVRTDQGKLELSATGKASLPLPDPIGFNFVLIDRSNKENTMRFFLAGAEKDWKVSPILKNQPLGSPINRLRLGSRAASSSATADALNFQGDIAEILVYTVHISESLREEILGYLRAKYFGLTGKP